MLRALASALPDWARVAWEALAPRAAGGVGRAVVVQAVVRGPGGVVLCERRELLPRFKESGATGIVEYPLSKIVD